MWIVQFSIQMASHTSSSEANITSLTMRPSRWRRVTLATPETLGSGGLVARKPKVLCYFRQLRKSEKKLKARSAVHESDISKFLELKFLMPQISPRSSQINPCVLWIFCIIQNFPEYAQQHWLFDSLLYSKPHTFWRGGGNLGNWEENFSETDWHRLIKMKWYPGTVSGTHKEK